MSWTQGKPHCKSPNVGAKTSKKLRLEKSTAEINLCRSAVQKAPISAPKHPKTIVSATILDGHLEHLADDGEPDGEAEADADGHAAEQLAPRRHVERHREALEHARLEHL